MSRTSFAKSNSFTANSFSHDELFKLIGKDHVSWHSGIPGFGIRTHASGRQSWIVFTRIKRKVTRVSLGSVKIVTEHQARTAAMTIVYEAKTGSDPLATKRTKRAMPTFPAFLAADERWGIRTWQPSTIRTYCSYRDNHLLPAFGHLYVDQITQGMVYDWFCKLSQTARGAANRSLEILRAAFERAIGWGLKLPQGNPCKGITRNRQKAYSRVLRDDELIRIGATLDALQRAHPVRVSALRLLMLTGCRHGEILNLRWEQVAGSRLNLTKSKTGPRGVQLGDATTAALRLVPRHPTSPWLFPQAKDPTKPIPSVGAFWHKVVLKRAKVKPLRIHDLRHNYASHAAILKENTITIAQLLGHSSTDNTHRYMHLADKPIRDAADLVCGIIANALEGVG
jgi:integrase